jgi:alanine-glyoxylate transaminase/serine-glyoxylate transaminase/serine-pyruvate transaminase
MTPTISLNNKHRQQLAPLATPQRLLMGPGPCNANPTVLAAMSTSLLGHLDPAFLQVMDEIQSLLRYVWQTDNPHTIAVSGTGDAHRCSWLFRQSIGGYGRSIWGRCPYDYEALGSKFCAR